MYECLLALEEADLRVVLETFERDDDGKNMGSVREKVVTFLQDSKKLSEVMTVKKGKVSQFIIRNKTFAIRSSF